MRLLAQSAWVGSRRHLRPAVDAGAVPADAQIVARIYVPISTQDQLGRGPGASPSANGWRA